jgi:hypothetical protein
MLSRDPIVNGQWLVGKTNPLPQQMQHRLLLTDRFGNFPDNFHTLARE